MENGTYTRSEELQSAFNRLKNEDGFIVYLQLFVTNNLKNADADKYIKEFNTKHPQYIADIYYLDDIKERYYGETEPIKQNITVKVESVNKGTILNINNEKYQLENVTDARYVLTPVVSIFRLYREAIERSYPIFDKNIREYLGNKGVNKRIYDTLQNEEDRKNFFYYNNGITIICDAMSSIKPQPSEYNLNAVFTIDNPQIVNGCQTVNTIYEFLKNVPASELEKEFKDTFVMLKILTIDRNDDSQKELYTNIVKYNNSQNAIDEKTFVANASEFVRLQKEFKQKGFLLLIKQSDKHQFSETYKSIAKLKELNNERLKKFGLKEVKKASDLFIPLEKLLQVINAFASGGHTAYVKKSEMVKFDSQPYNTAIKFIKDDLVTTDILLDLFLLYQRAEQTKKENYDSRAPIPYYLIDFFAKYECKNRNVKEIQAELSDLEKINRVISLYTNVTRLYTNKYYQMYNVDYNKMIKRTVKYDIVDEYRDIVKDIK